MSYEVIKHVGERAYRYSVESYRDPESKKVRGKWTYLGPADAAEGHNPKPKRDTRALIVAAFIELTEANAGKPVTVSQLVAKVDIAQGTFYRYFKTMDDLISQTTAPCVSCGGAGHVVLVTQEASA